MEAFISEYWPAIISVLPLLAKLLNKLTPHWSDYVNPVMRVIGLVVEAMDILRKPADIRKGLKTKDQLAEKIKEMRKNA